MSRRTKDFLITVAMTAVLIATYCAVEAIDREIRMEVVKK
jgi:hypothetical protein